MRKRDATEVADGERAIGTARRIDQLGRIVVPAELRRMVGIHTGDLVDFRLVDGHIAVTKVTPECVLCGRGDRLVHRHGKPMCTECLREIRSEPTCAICGDAAAGLLERHGKFVCPSCVREMSPV